MRGRKGKKKGGEVGLNSFGFMTVDLLLGGALSSKTLGLGLQVLESLSESTVGLHGVGINVVELLLGDLDDVGEVGLILGVDVDESESSGGLLSDDLTESGLVLDDDVGDTLLLAKSGQPEGDLEGVDVVGNDDQLGELLLNEGGDVTDAGLDNVGLDGLGLSLLGGRSGL